MKEQLPGSQWDSVSKTALVWTRKLLSSSDLTDPPSSVLWTQSTSDDVLVREALSRHRIIPPVAAWLGREPSEPVSTGIRTWLDSERQIVRRQVVAHLAAASKLQTALSGAGVRALFIKGPFQAKQATGDPAGRGSGDLDLLVEPHKFDTALAALSSVGAILMDKELSKPLAEKVSQVHHAMSLELSGISVDLHRRLDPNPARMQLPFEDLWRERDTLELAGVDFATLGPLDACVLVASHGCRDGWLQIRQLVDFAQSLNRARGAGYDLLQLQHRAKQQGVVRRLSVALAVNRIVVPELPPQSEIAELLARWTWSRYRSGRVDVGVRSPRNAVSMLAYSSLSEEGLEGVTYAMRRLSWFTSTNVDPLAENLPLWSYPLLAPVNVGRRMFESTRSHQDRRPQNRNSLDLMSREHLLLTIALATHAIDLKSSWEEWRELVPDLNAVTSTEISLLSVAWRNAKSSGATDPMSGRLEGVQRRSYVNAVAILGEAARVQQSLTDSGIRSELTGVAAAALAYPHLARWPFLRAELWIDRAARGVGVASPTTSVLEELFGRRRVRGSGPPVALTWRQPDRKQAKYYFSDTTLVDRQGHSLLVAAPHIAAMHVLTRALPASKPGSGGSLIAFLDLYLLSRSPHFDGRVFRDLWRASLWHGVFAAHVRAVQGLIPQDLLEIIRSSPPCVGGEPSSSTRSPRTLGQDLIANQLPRAINLGVRVLS